MSDVTINIKSNTDGVRSGLLALNKSLNALKSQVDELNKIKLINDESIKSSLAKINTLKSDLESAKTSAESLKVSMNFAKAAGMGADTISRIKLEFNDARSAVSAIERELASATQEQTKLLSVSSRVGDVLTESERAMNSVNLKNINSVIRLGTNLKKNLGYTTQMVNPSSKVASNSKVSADASGKTSTNTSKISSNLSASAKSTTLLSSGFRNVLQTTISLLSALGIQSGLSGAVDAVKNAIEVASSSGEYLNVLTSAFTSNSDEMISWAQNSAESYGMANSEARKYLGTLGSMFSTSGLSEDIYKDMTLNLTKLSGDIASFYNMSVSDAYRKISSALAGEIEPLRSIGINVSVTNLQEYMDSLKINADYSDLDQANKMLVTYNFLMHNTSLSQGDFAKTSTSYANSVKSLQLEWTNLLEKIGNYSIPLLTPVVKFFATVLAYANAVVDAIAKILGLDTYSTTSQIAVDTGIASDNTSNITTNVDDTNKSLKDQQKILKSNTKLLDLYELVASEVSNTVSDTGVQAPTVDLSGLASYDYSDIKSPFDDIEVDMALVDRIAKGIVEFARNAEAFFSGVAEGLSDIWNFFKPVVEWVGDILGLTTPDGWKSFGELVTKIAAGLAIFKVGSWLFAGIRGISRLFSGAVNGGDSFLKFLTGGSGLSKALGGIIGLLGAGAGGFGIGYLLYGGIDETEVGLAAIATLVGGIGIAALGVALGPWGVLAGALVTLVAGMYGLETAANDAAGAILEEKLKGTETFSSLNTDLGKFSEKLASIKDYSADIDLTVNMNIEELEEGSKKINGVIAAFANGEIDEDTLAGSLAEQIDDLNTSLSNTISTLTDQRVEAAASNLGTLFADVPLYKEYYTHVMKLATEAQYEDKKIALNELAEIDEKIKNKTATADDYKRVKELSDSLVSVSEDMGELEKSFDDLDVTSSTAYDDMNSYYNSGVEKAEDLRDANLKAAESIRDTLANSKTLTAERRKELESALLDTEILANLGYNKNMETLNKYYNDATKKLSATLDKRLIEANYDLLKEYSISTDYNISVREGFTSDDQEAALSELTKKVNEFYDTDTALSNSALKEVFGTDVDITDENGNISAEKVLAFAMALKFVEKPVQLSFSDESPSIGGGGDIGPSRLEKDLLAVNAKLEEDGWERDSNGKYTKTTSAVEKIDGAVVYDVDYSGFASRAAAYEADINKKLEEQAEKSKDSGKKAGESYAAGVEEGTKSEDSKTKVADASSEATDNLNQEGKATQSGTATGDAYVNSMQKELSSEQTMEILNRLGSNLLEGVSSPEDAMKLGTAIIDNLGGGIVRATQVGGVLDGALKRLSDNFKNTLNSMLDDTSSFLTKIKNALINLNEPKTNPLGALGTRDFAIRLPHLATGAVIAPNNPFMAVLGDQRSGLNVETPVSTIEEAVRSSVSEALQNNQSGTSAQNVSVQVYIGDRSLDDEIIRVVTDNSLNIGR